MGLLPVACMQGFGSIGKAVLASGWVRCTTSRRSRIPPCAVTSLKRVRRLLRDKRSLHPSRLHRSLPCPTLLSREGRSVVSSRLPGMEQTLRRGLSSAFELLVTTTQCRALWTKRSYPKKSLGKRFSMPSATPVRSSATRQSVIQFPRAKRPPSWKSAPTSLRARALS